jgi:uncharacterized repeat protein (TIGR03843 family)
MAAKAATRRLLEDGDIEVVGRMPFSSNATFLAHVHHGATRGAAVYKPGRGERPLWDFPDGLYRREVAAFELSEALGWGLVPVTVLRDGPLGIGSLQEFIEADVGEHYFTLCERDEHLDELRRICVFDLISNNTDRKGGHCLLGQDGRLYAIDNALCFHADFKLRTVIWDFAGEPIPAAVLADVDRFVSSGLPDSLASLLDPFERDAMLTRARAVLTERCFPHDPTGRRYPWPMV